MRISRFMSSVLCVVSPFFVRPICGSEPFTGYLFAYFTGNDNTKNQESIFFALSEDGHTFKKLNRGNPVLVSREISLEGGVRDPHILRGENSDYYMVATDMVSAKGWASNSGIVMLRSNNLTDWQSSTVDITTEFSQYANVDRVWAPQTIYDPVEKKYMVYLAMRIGPTDKDKIYYAYADSAFTKLESAPKLLYQYGSNSAIDADIIYKDSTWHLFFKTEQSGNGIKKATSGNLTGDYVLYDKYLQVTNSAVEGSCVFRLIDSDNYVLMYDVYTSGRYEFALSADLMNFTIDPTPVSFDFTPRHGTVIPITQSEKMALYARWDPTVAICGSRRASSPLHLSCRNNTLTVTSGDMNGAFAVSLFDLSGKRLFERRVTAGKTRVPLSGLSAGVYQVTCRGSNLYRAMDMERVVVR